MRDQARERALTGEESRHEQAVEEETGALTRGLGTLASDKLESMLQVRTELDINMATTVTMKALSPSV